LSLLDWLTRRTKFDSAETKEAIGVNDVFADLFAQASSISGPAVGPYSAMAVPAVSAAVNLIASTCGTLPAKVFGRNDDGTKQPAPKHPAYRLVHDDANDWTSASDLRAQLTRDALLLGAGYGFANRVNSRVQEFIRLDPHKVTPLQDDVTGEPAFQLGDGRTKRILKHTDVLHIPAIDGVAPIKRAREAIALALTLEKHAAQLFGRGGRPSGVLKFPSKLGAEVVKRISTAWHAAHSGDAAGKTAVLEEGGDFQPLTFNSVDSQFKEMRSFQILEIARAFGVPPQFLMELDRATWSNAEEMNRQFLQFTMLPWLRTWEAAYRHVLLSHEERDTNSIEFIVDDLLRADTAVRAESYAKGRAGGWLTANEVRKWENLPALPGGDTLQSPYTTSNSAGAQA
jgi:HK97 family phage portal protein